MDIVPPRRNLYPTHQGVRPDDQSKLYLSLRKSNIHLGHSKSPRHEKLDTSPTAEETRMQFHLNRRDFSKIK